jgi:hypothetical protein
VWQVNKILTQPRDTQGTITVLTRGRTNLIHLPGKPAGVSPAFCVRLAGNLVHLPDEPAGVGVAEQNQDRRRQIELLTV